MPNLLLTFNKNRHLNILFITVQILFILTCFTTVNGQNDEYYTITGKVIDEKGNPDTDAGIFIESVEDLPAQLDSFVEGVGTNSEGVFTKKISKNPQTIGQNYFLYVYIDNNLNALTVVEPPFTLLRRHDRRYNGKLVKLEDKKFIDVGVVKVQFWYGQANLNFADYFKKKNIDPRGRVWGRFFLRIRDEKGYRVDEGTLSDSDIKKYVDQANSKLRICLPEGKWKVEISEEFEKPQIAETAYFEVIKDEKPKEIIVFKYKVNHRRRLEKIIK